MKNVLTVLSNMAVSFTAKMAEQEAITKKGFRHITDKVNVVNENVGVVVERITGLEEKVDMILSGMNSTGAASQEPQVHNTNAHRTTRQYNAISNTLTPIKTSAKGEAIFGICEDCGTELTSNLVVGYCKANGLPVYCPTCQRKHKVDAKSRGIGKAAAKHTSTPSKAAATPSKAPKTAEAKEFLLVRTCGCCGEYIKYTSAEMFNESQRKAKALGLPKYIHGKCAATMLAEMKAKAEAPVVNAPVAEEPFAVTIDPVVEAPVTPVVEATVPVVIDTVEKAFELLVSDTMSVSDLSELKIAELRKLGDLKGYKVELNGKDWNSNKKKVAVPVVEVPVEEVVPVVEAPVVEVPVVDVPVIEEAPIVETPVADVPVVEDVIVSDVSMVAESTENWVAITPKNKVSNKEVAGQFSLIGEDGTRLF